MATIRRIEISNFRGIRHLEWNPSPGINCLIGAGDSGKSTVLDAIDLCLGARRFVQLDDSDFTGLDPKTPICIDITIGDLDADMKNLETYGGYLRGWDGGSGRIEDEPGIGLETVLTVRLRASEDLEPEWKLLSDRAEASGQSRSLSWKDRTSISPARLGTTAEYHLRWGRGSILNRFSDGKPNLGASLAEAAREARETFGDSADTELHEALAAVSSVADELGIDVGASPRALLDVHAVSFGAGTIALHAEDGTPLHRLGVGSIRLLVAGLQRRAAKATTVLVDELEYGLEPHRLTRLLHALGSKETPPPLQCFITTHSPIALEELRSEQLFVLRPSGASHAVIPAGSDVDVQAALRRSPSAFLARVVIACEGATEVGLVRGLDRHRSGGGVPPLGANAAAIADLGGGDAERMLRTVKAFRSLGYGVVFVRDDDKPPEPSSEAAFLASGGEVVSWGSGRALEDELFLSLAAEDVGKLLALAIEEHGRDSVDNLLKSLSGGTVTIDSLAAMCATGAVPEDARKTLASAAKSKAAWFKRIDLMESAAYQIVGPGLDASTGDLRAKVESIFTAASRR